MFQTDEIHESFYELFNQRFRILDDPKKGRRYFTNISIGAHTKPCRVHPQFQCIVVLKKSELHQTPPAFLNRFEKFSLSYDSIFSSILLSSFNPNMKTVVTCLVSKVHISHQYIHPSPFIYFALIQMADFVNTLHGSRSLYGCYTTEVKTVKDVAEIKQLRRQISSKSVLPSSEDSIINVHETLYSLLLSLFPAVSHKYVLASDIGDIVEYEDRRMTILTTALKALQEKAGFSIPKVTDINHLHIFMHVNLL